MEHVKIIKVPFFSEDTNEMKIGKIFRTTGEYVNKNESFIELENDKACIESPSDFEGKILHYFVKEKDSVKVGDPICVISNFKSEAIIKQFDIINSEVKELNSYFDFFIEVTKLLNLPFDSKPNDILKVIEKLESNKN